MLAVKILNEGEFCCVVVKDNGIKHAVNGRGVKPLLKLYKENIEDLEDSSIADKVIGKAAASILICARVKEVYGKIISKRALEFLDKHNVKVKYNILVEEIRNISNTDMCPLEKLVQNIDKAEEAVMAISEFIEYV